MHRENGGVVHVNQSVTVASDGGGNFSAIADAVAFAPNDTSTEYGYFAIYIGEGVYEENVVVGKKKKNLILIGAGNNRTVVTGNRSVADGWSTFNSATFGEYTWIRIDDVPVYVKKINKNKVETIKIFPSPGAGCVRHPRCTAPSIARWTAARGSARGASHGQRPRAAVRCSRGTAEDPRAVFPIQSRAGTSHEPRLEKV